MIVKKHLTNDKKLVLAVCDSDLLGKKFEDRGLQLDLSSRFYRGEETTESTVAALMKNTYALNIVGKDSVKTAINCGMIKKENIIYIKKIPHAQAVVIAE